MFCGRAPRPAGSALAASSERRVGVRKPGSVCKIGAFAGRIRVLAPHKQGTGERTVGRILEVMDEVPADTTSYA
jgi:hypothetical protein